MLRWRSALLLRAFQCMGHMCCGGIASVPCGTRLLRYPPFYHYAVVCCRKFTNVNLDDYVLNLNTPPHVGEL